MQWVAAHLSLCVKDGFSLVGCRDEFKPLPEGVAQRLWQGVDVPQDDVEGEGELLHVGADLWELPRPFEYGDLDVEDGVLQRSTEKRCLVTVCLRKSEIQVNPNSACLTRELGLSRTTKITNTFALRAARTAAVTRSFPSRKRPLPSETMTSSWAVSVEGGQRSEVQGIKG